MKSNLIFNSIGAILIFLSLIGCNKENEFSYGTVTDVEGNIYKTIQIGTQTWMAENLKTTKYSDGTDIQLVIDSEIWEGLTTPGYCWYYNDTTNKIIYGALYNWYTINTAKLAPSGWHIPNDNDFAQLIDYLGGESVAGSKLKEAGLDPGATNQSGFTAIPGGLRIYSGAFTDIGRSGFWWSSTAGDDKNAGCLFLECGFSVVVYTSYDKHFGFSVRCVKD